ncbi:MAG TPA: serine/threonine-protein kinase [Kofleriaceae bacterium]
MTGASFGHYRVVRQLGAGGMGAVYLGQHELIGRQAAIKVLLPELSAQRGSVDRFFHEARATSVVSDPGIVQIYDFGFTDEQIAFIVMEYLDGEPLSARLHRLVTLTPSEALRITRQAAGSLAAAHGAGIVHRDLKPDNLFLVRDPEAPGGERTKILDFGVAKLGEDDPANQKITRAGQIMGTPTYMSPEQANGRVVDHRADVYSLGCVLFQMLTGRPPFDIPGTYGVISAHINDRPPNVTEVAPHLPPMLDPIVARCLAKKPADRFASMVELQAACDAILATATPELALQRASGARPVVVASPMQTTLGHSTGQPFVAPGRPRRRFGMWIAGGAGAVAIGIALAIVTASRGPKLAAPANVAPAIAPTPAPPPPPPPPVVVPAQAPVAISIDAGVPIDAARPVDAPPVTKPSKRGAKPKAADDLYEDR